MAMRCLRCRSASEGYAVIPAQGETGEIRFFCDACARAERLKLRYWDGRDLAPEGSMSPPGLGTSFYTLVFTFDDLGRMRWEDLSAVLEWVEDRELAIALVGSPPRFQQKLLAALRGGRAMRVRELLRQPEPGEDLSPIEAQRRIIDLVRKL